MKKTIKAIGFITILAIALAGFSTCDNGTIPSHVHSFSATWSSNAAQHWNDCTDPDCDKKSNIVNHSGHNCECGYTTHTFSEEWHKDGTIHWKGCTDAYCEEKDSSEVHSGNPCGICGYTFHVHSFSEDWSKGSEHHWKECTVGDCEEKSEIANHSPANGICVTCGYDNTSVIAGAAVSAPTAAGAAITYNSIIIAAVTAPGNGQTVEYAISTSNTAPETGWQDSTTFTGLAEETVYYIFARSKENVDYYAGAASTGLELLTNYHDSMSNFYSFEPQLRPHPYRASVLISKTAQIETPSTMSGFATFTVHANDASILELVSQTGDYCIVKGLSLGSARLSVTANGTTETVIVTVTPQSLYTLPADQVKRGDDTTFRSTYSGSLTSLTQNSFVIDPTYQLAWRYNGGNIDIRAYYVDRVSSVKRGFVETTYNDVGWKYRLNNSDVSINTTTGAATAGNLRLELKPEFIYDGGIPYLQITQTLTNTGDTALTNQRFGVHADVMIYGNDDAPITYMSQYGVRMEDLAADATMRFRLVCQGLESVSDVSTLWVGNYGNRSANLYNDLRVDVSGIDSGMAFSYQNIDLAPGESRDFVVRFTQVQ